MTAAALLLHVLAVLSSEIPPGGFPFDRLTISPSSPSQPLLFPVQLLAHPYLLSLDAFAIRFSSRDTMHTYTMDNASNPVCFPYFTMDMVTRKKLKLSSFQPVYMCEPESPRPPLYLWFYPEGDFGTWAVGADTSFVGRQPYTTLHSAALGPGGVPIMKTIMFQKCLTFPPEDGLGCRRGPSNLGWSTVNDDSTKPSGTQFFSERMFDFQMPRQMIIENFDPPDNVPVFSMINGIYSQIEGQHSQYVALTCKPSLKSCHE